MRKNKFRIVEDNWSGYEVQIKFWWFPFAWLQVDYNLGIFGTNTFSTIEEARGFIVKTKTKTKTPKPSITVVEYVDVDELLAGEEK